MIRQTQPDRVLRSVLEQNGYRSSSAVYLADELIKGLHAAGWHLLGTPHEIRAPNRGFGRESEDVEMRIQLDNEIIAQVHTHPKDLYDAWTDKVGFMSHVRRELAVKVLHELGKRLGFPS